MIVRCVLSILLLAVLCRPAHSQPADSLRVLVELSKDRPLDGDVWFRLAEAYLAADSLEKSAGAAKQAMRQEDSARSLDLMGRILTRRKAWVRNAPPYFRKAYAKDKTFVDALYHLAQYEHQLGNEDEEKVLREVIAADSTYSQAYLDLGMFLFDRGDNAGAREAYLAYVDLEPGQPDGYYGLAVVATDEADYETALERGQEMISADDEDPRGYAIVGQALAARGEHDEAADMFALYLWMIPEEERAHYEDLSLIASKEELQKLTSASLPEQARLTKQFWKRHDPTLVTGGDIRKLEHYRRVWYARTYYSTPGSPWDRRGDVFIRYGEPDYRSRSYAENTSPPPDVQSVKEKMAYELFRTGTRYDSGLPDEVGIPIIGHSEASTDIMSGGSAPDGSRSHAEYNSKYVIGRPWTWEVRVPEGESYRVYVRQPPDLESGGYIGPVFPVHRDQTGTTDVPWESWVYTDLGNDVEFVFTDEFMQGTFDFAPMPSMYHSDLVTTALQFDPAPLYQKISSEQPEQFGPPPGIRPLDFYYDYATFKGKRGLTQVELYFGVPAANLLDSVRTFRTGVSFQRKVALEGQSTGELIQESDQIALNKPLHLSTSRGGMYVSSLTVTAIPDTYRLAVQLTDRETGKWGLYMQDLVVPAYSDSLELSDLQVSSQASDSTRIEAFKKGDFWIVPAPSRMFPDSSSVFLYYEVYGMAKDAMGMSDYTVSYTIREQKENERSFGSLLRSITGGGKPEGRETTFTLQRYSWDRDEKVFFEIEPDQLLPGLKRVQVSITDNTTGATAERDAVLWVQE